MINFELAECPEDLHMKILFCVSIVEGSLLELISDVYDVN